MGKEQKDGSKNESKGFISILSDYGFKITFGDESDTRFLRKVLATVIPENWKFQELTFGNSVFAGLNVESRGGIYDVILRDEHKNTFILEMQLTQSGNFIHRAQFYLFHVLNQSVKKGPYKFDDLNHMYCIAFTGYDLLSELEGYYHVSKLKNQHGEVIDHLISYIIIEISKFDKEESELKTELDKLIYFMKYTDQRDETTEVPQFIREDKIFFETLLKLDQRNMTLDEIMHHEFALAKLGSQIEGYEILERDVAEKKQELAETKREVAETKREVAKQKREVAEKEREVEQKEREKNEMRQMLEKEVKKAEEMARKAETALKQGVKNLLSIGRLNEVEIAETLGVTVKFVEAVRNEGLQ